jgi:carboxymethylenebutenolidase
VDDRLKQEAILLYDRFTHEGLDRRVFMARMVALAGSVAAAEALLASIAASPAAAAIVPADDPRLTTRTQNLVGAYKAYVAEPRTRSLKATVVVVHENRGLNDHIRDVARRLGIAGFRAVAPLDLGRSVTDGVAMIGELSKSSRGGKVGAIGFCWGGGFVNRLAVAAGGKLNAAVPYYGPAPDPSEATKVQAPMLIHDAGLDDRVNSTSFPWVEALRAAKKPVKFYLYDGVNHAFNNDTSSERYNKAAADLAWKRTLDFFHVHLDA